MADDDLPTGLHALHFVADPDAYGLDDLLKAVCGWSCVRGGQSWTRFPHATDCPDCRAVLASLSSPGDLVVLEVEPGERLGRGRYWSPNGCGYTDDIAHAGLFRRGEKRGPSTEIDPLPALRERLAEVNGLRDRLVTMIAVVEHGLLGGGDGLDPEILSKRALAAYLALRPDGVPQ